MSLNEDEKRGFKTLIEIDQKFNERDTQAMKHGETQAIKINEAEMKLASGQVAKNIIAVDSREFSSMTPVYLYEEGFWIIPM